MFHLCEARPDLSGALFVIAIVEKFNLIANVLRNDKKAGTEGGKRRPNFDSAQCDRCFTSSLELASSACSFPRVFCVRHLLFRIENCRIHTRFRDSWACREKCRAISAVGLWCSN